MKRHGHPMLFKAWDGTAEALCLPSKTGGLFATARLPASHRQAAAARLRSA